ncbi:LLM class flavin-dependent oxidoreductase [Sphingomonas canadensis]|uniref:LLM class flavin-dependent oxidoreductase n=1 Tax=Sphingomonas canadensis TaxID=1219257 RepID=A0ABW3H7J8_9SPHN|nr:LLM class flavin-dependent oxidoreductase [Sphingomonas canadensis]MCW3836982.1 LLM class flavin-dependent oxidoreductase [Sphingomonas canadensis]
MNRLKLGTFGFNLDGGFTATTAEERHRLDWPTVARVAGLAEQAGFELQVPLARWRGLGGVTNYCGTNYEGLSWAAGVGAITRQSQIFATVHVPVIHPIVAAKQMVTADHISGGRFGLNLVCGWFPPEFAMFGSPMMDHDSRYRYAAEWIDIVKLLWTREEEFDFEGEFFRIVKGQSNPKPLQNPHPPIMQAGQSGTGARFAAKYADIAFQSVSEGEPIEDIRRRFADLRRLGREEFGREFEIWLSCWVICRPTQTEAERFRDYVLEEKGDLAVLDSMPPNLVPKGGGPEARLARQKVLGGFGGVHLVGSPAMIVDRLAEFSAAGADGIVLTFVNYEEGLQTWMRDVAPLLVQAGLRK